MIQLNERFSKNESNNSNRKSMTNESRTCIWWKTMYKIQTWDILQKQPRTPISEIRLHPWDSKTLMANYLLNFNIFYRKVNNNNPNDNKWCLSCLLSSGIQVRLEVVDSRYQLLKFLHNSFSNQWRILFHLQTNFFNKCRWTLWNLVRLVAFNPSLLEK